MAWSYYTYCLPACHCMWNHIGCYLHMIYYKCTENVRIIYISYSERPHDTGVDVLDIFDNAGICNGIYHLLHTALFAGIGRYYVFISCPTRRNGWYIFCSCCGWNRTRKVPSHLPCYMWIGRRSKWDIWCAARIISDLGCTKHHKPWLAISTETENRPDHSPVDIILCNYDYCRNFGAAISYDCSGNSTSIARENVIHIDDNLKHMDNHSW